MATKAALVRRVPTGRLRRRLAIAFVLVGGLSAGALAGGAYLLVRHSRLQDSVDRAVAQARFNLVLAQRTASIANLQTSYSLRGDFYTVIAEHGRVPPGRLPVPADLRQLVDRQDRMAYERIEVQGDPLLVVGVPQVSRDRQLYFYFDERQLWSDLDLLRDVLIGGWLIAVVLCGLAGVLLSRRMLRPVAAAGAAARSLAEGLLDTRLPAGGQDEFGAWAVSFNQMADALQTKITALTEAREREQRFTADVAHELRTPLTALVNEAAVLAQHQGAMPADAARMSELLTRDLGRLRRLVDDLLEVASLDAGQEVLRLEPIETAGLVADLVTAAGWDGGVEVEPGGAPVVSDRRRLERILANLIANAIQHGGGHAVVRVTGTADETTIDVTDRGPGIPAEFRDRLFDRFSKADFARSGAGTGLGLAIAAENAALLGGRIDVEDAPGGGARFALHLPHLEQGGTS